MHILIGLATAAALLYFWLLGHWFARVLVFLGLAFCAGFAGLLVGSSGHGAEAGGVLTFLAGVVAAWFAAGIPIYYWRYQLGLPSKLREFIEFERPAQPPPTPAPSPARTPPPPAPTYEPPLPWTQSPPLGPWTPPRPPRPLPFERIWRPKLEMAMSPRGLVFALIGIWVISIAGVIAEKF